MKPTIEEIMANEILGLNNWYTLSFEYDWTIEEMRELKQKLNWKVILAFKNNIDCEILDELISENIIDLSNRSIKSYLLRQKTIKKWFLQKYIQYFDILELGAFKIFTSKELINIFGKPSVGDGCTQFCGSDCYPFTVIQSNPNSISIVVQEDIAIPSKNFDFYENQKYEYLKNEKGVKYTVKLNKSGKWVSDGMVFSTKRRRKYIDPCF